MAAHSDPRCHEEIEVHVCKCGTKRAMQYGRNHGTVEFACECTQVWKNGVCAIGALCVERCGIGCMATQGGCKGPIKSAMH